ncbi:MAG: DUF4252 domain-containing protein [Bacteroidia bacterium]|nr:DUF4252 domain-containing protein [Bacteroidia bacterium]
MKKTSILFLLCALLTTPSTFGQSKSYQALKDNFIDRPDVHSFTVNGFFCRLVLGMAGEWEFKEAVRDVQHIKLITIPAEEFKAQGLSVNGFKKVLRNDSFEELASIHDHGDDVTFYLQSTGKKNRYIVLIQEPDEVVVIELKGSIDVNLLVDKDNTLSYQN